MKPFVRYCLASLLFCVVACGEEPSTSDVSPTGARSAAMRDPNEEPPPWEPPVEQGEPENSPVEPPVAIDGVTCNIGSTAYLTFDGHKCTGVLIRPDLVLTAAHCMVAASSPGAVSAGVGPVMCIDGASRGVAIQIDPRYVDGVVNHDLALVRLSTPINTATIAEVGAFPAYHQDVTLSGFGLDGFDAPQSNAQHCADTRVVGTRGERITLGKNNRACQGDSGGPVYQRGTTRVVGIMSQAESNCLEYTYATPIDQGWLASAIATVDAVSSSCTDGATQPCTPENAACVPLDANHQAVGACHNGQRTCANGAWSGCVGYVGPSAEVCIDGIDQNCNGIADDGCPPSGGELCPPGFAWNDVFGQCLCAVTSCPYGYTLNTISCTCETGCGDGICQFNESRFTCALDCGPPPTYGCICGAPEWQGGCPAGTPGCGPVCGDGYCDVIQEVQSGPYPCSLDCDEPGGSVCICGYDCPPGTPGCDGGGGGGGGGGDPGPYCGEDWDWWVTYYGEDMAWSMWEIGCVY